MPLVKKTDSDPLLLKPPAVNRRPGGQPGVVAVPAATIFYLFEVVIVVSIQAYIFAALSAIYIGSAIEPEH